MTVLVFCHGRAGLCIAGVTHSERKLSRGGFKSPGGNRGVGRDAMLDIHKVRVLRVGNLFDCITTYPRANVCSHSEPAAVALRDKVANAWRRARSKGRRRRQRNVSPLASVLILCVGGGGDVRTNASAAASATMSVGAALVAFARSCSPPAPAPLD
jgi:hypothetical protein